MSAHPQVEFRQVGKTFADGTRALRGLDLSVESGEFLVLLGPSGCGKSTALRLLAGLDEPTEGDIYIDGLRVNDLPAGARQLGMVFQSYALYPHMTVRDNLLFGLRHGSGEVDEAEMTSRMEEAVALLDLDGLMERLPKELSGGQQQRVAIGRALVKRPKVILMDEPLSNLDARLRNRMRSELRRLHHLHGTTTVYVTHDQTEAMTLADRIAILQSGELQQHGKPLDVYEQPANTFVASFLGAMPMNLIEGRAASGYFEAAGLRFPLPPHLADSDGPGTYGVRPERIVIGAAGGVGAELEDAEHLGNETILHFRIGEHPLRASVRSEARGQAYRVGDTLSLDLAVSSAFFFPNLTGGK